MAKQSVRFEYDLHEQVITPMTTILSEIKEIEILKRKLSHARLDMDSANAVLKRKQKGNDTDTVLLANAENACNQFHMAQDTYITALLSFSSKEYDHIKPLQCLLTCQQKMFNDVSKILNAKLPGLQDNIEKTANTPVFGTDLDKHLDNTGKPVATVLQKCCSSLLRSGIEQPGIFRLAGGLPQLRKLKAMFDSNRMDEEEWEQDVFTLAQAIKLYLRELPEPLLTFDMFEEWIACIGNPRVTERVTRCRDLVQKLPNSFQINLQYVIWFLSQVASREAENKMGASNLGLVLGPNVLRTKNEDDNESITALNAGASLVELMIRNYSVIFPESLPADLTRLSLPRANTVSGAINTSRPSVRSHKKGKAPTPKRPTAAPLPPPRVDLDKSVSVPALPIASRSSAPSTPVKSHPAHATSEPVLNPFGDSDDEELVPEPPKREGRNLNLDSSIPVKQEEDDECNPFNSPTPDGMAEDNPFGPESVPEDTSAIAERVQEREEEEEEDDDDDFNPFGDSDGAVSEEEVAPPTSPRKISPPPPPKPEKKSSPPPITAKPKSVSEDVVSFENTESPTFSRSSNRSTPSHSRNASGGSINTDPLKKQHSRTPSDTANKPAPPPRHSLEQ